MKTNFSKKKFLVCGAGGFIGGHLVENLKNEGHEVICADSKPYEYWFQINENNINYSLDLKEYENCLKVTDGVDYIYNMACNMGGMGFIENNKAECMLSVLINTNLLRACLVNKIKKYFFSSSACVYNASKQKNNFIPGLKEEDAYPADPEDGYGWEKLFSERMCRHFMEDFGLETRVARYHNVYGPLGTYDGGREKAPAALCRKVIEAKLNKRNYIDVWGDGEQTRSFMFIKDCIIGTKMLFESNESTVLNIGSEEQVSINQMIKFIEEISDYKVNKNYQLDKPKGVRGRSSNNDLIKKTIGWDSTVTLKEGLKETYNWIYTQMTSGSNNNKFSRKY
jgi:nucleoside-diphosphate-sugar epimerase